MWVNAKIEIPNDKSTIATIPLPRVLFMENMPRNILSLSKFLRNENLTVSMTESEMRFFKIGKASMHPDFIAKKGQDDLYHLNTVAIRTQEANAVTVMGR
jgi:hypothetical protein